MDMLTHSLDRFMKMMTRVRDNATQEKVLSEKQLEFLNSSEFEKDFWNQMIVEVRELWQGSRVLHALPGQDTTIQDLQILMDFNGTAFQMYNATVKNQEWMEEHGQCMDNIREGVSSIPHAGRGAFASRKIRKGRLVAPAPLIHLPNRSNLVMYEPKICEDGKWRRNTAKPIASSTIIELLFRTSRIVVVTLPVRIINILYQS